MCLASCILHFASCLLHLFGHKAAQDVHRLEDAGIAQGVVDGRAVAFGVDQATLAQDAQVVGDGGLRHVQQLGQLGDVARAFSDEVEQSQAFGVAQALAYIVVHEGDFVFGDNLCDGHLVYILIGVYIEQYQYNMVRRNVKEKSNHKYQGS